MKIKDIIAREILDSRGNPTIEVDLLCEGQTFRASVPSGASTGKYEALELRDKDQSRYNGKGVLNAIANVTEKIKPLLFDKECLDQAEIDKILLEADGTENKSNLGANAMLAVSMAVCRAGAFAQSKPLYEYIANLAGTKDFVLPVPSFNIINGGEHAANKLPFQEFMILPVGASNFREALQIGSEVYHALKGQIKAKYGQNSVNVGDEGGFAPDVKDAQEVIEIINSAIVKSGHEGKVKIGLDVAASEFYKDPNYDFGFKCEQSDLKTKEEMVAYYKELVAKYGLVSIEDPFDQDDFDSYKKLNSEIGNQVQIVGDDLLVTNPKRIQTAIQEQLCNALLLKINQIGTISEAIMSAKMAQQAGWGVMVSHRSGETEDSFIADLVVGLKAGQIKTGAPCRGERLAKYNQLLRIEEQLQGKCSYAGNNFRKP